MSEQELLDFLHSIEEDLRNWAKEIREYVRFRIQEYNAEYPDNSISLCVDPTPRIKEDKSFVTKALFRNKGYTNPCVQITDKVGVRFVVLTTADIEVLRKIIVENNDWISSCDKDYQQDLFMHPLVFDYQSVHYVIKRKHQNNYDVTNNPITCEVQIRTILQHSFAEISHLCAYKSPFNVESKTKRELARTMAFIDTSDLIFNQTRSQIESSLAEYRQWNKGCRTLLETFNVKYDEYDVLNAEIFLFVFPKLSNYQRPDIFHYIAGLIEIIREIINEGGSIYFHQPMIILMVYYASVSPRAAYHDWNIESKDKQYLFTKLGISIDSFE